ncbi:MAG: hypothetical protein QXQ02_10490 [Halobacteria archaeon]
MALQTHVKDAIKEEITKDEYKSLTSEQVYALLTTPEIEKTVETKPKEVSFVELLNALSPDFVKFVITSPVFPLIREMVLNQDFNGLYLFLLAFNKSGIISNEDFESLTQLFSRTEEVVVEKVKGDGLPRLYRILSGIANAPNYISYEEFLECWNEAREG